ncbi:MAG TPA: phosphoribosyltransferase [Acidimicrobiales bacterium]|nr:phosphoribosyltransferase [Acidimicrobiales bacterium]
MCDGPTRPGFGLCFCCSTLVGQLRMPLAPVTAVTPYRMGDGMHRLLRGYKDAPSEAVCSASAARLAGVVQRWLDDHFGRLLGRTRGPWDLVVGVPSSHRRTGTPVDTLVQAVPALVRTHRRLLVRGPEPTDHLVAARSGFTVTPDLGRKTRGVRALVVDDSFTTGARAQSAATALRMAGIRVAGVLVVGRAVAPETAPWQAAYWDSTAEVRRAARAASRPGDPRPGVGSPA